MAVEEVVNTSTGVIAGSITSLGKFALILQAVGIVIIINIIFQIVGFIYTRRMNKRLKRIETILNVRHKKRY